MVGTNEIELTTLREVLAVSYANLAMAHYAVERGDAQYGSVAYSIRARLRKGLLDGSLSARSLYDDEKVKLNQGAKCSYVVNDLPFSVRLIPLKFPPPRELCL